MRVAGLPSKRTLSTRFTAWPSASLATQPRSCWDGVCVPRAETGTSSTALTCCARPARVRFRWPVTREKLVGPIPSDCGIAPLDGPAAGALACSPERAPAAALGPAARVAPPAVDEAADEELEPRLRWLSP